MHRGKMLLVFAAVGALLTASCGKETAGSLANPLEITARDYTFEGAPATINGGVVTVKFSNAGKAQHELAFVDIGDTSLATFKKEFPPVLQGGPFPKFMAGGVVPAEAAPGESVTKTFTLPPGKYLLMCALTDKPGKADDNQDNNNAPAHYTLGMAQRVAVEGEAAQLNATAGEVKAKDYTFEFSNLTPGRSKLVFRNTGDQWHFGEVMEFPEGITPEVAEAKFKEGLQLPEGSPPPPGMPEPQEAGFSGVFSPGMAGTFTVTFKVGRTYLFACFLQDRTGGPPHAIKYGMVKAVKVG